jgi:hypothetical protein
VEAGQGIRRTQRAGGPRDRLSKEARAAGGRVRGAVRGRVPYREPVPRFLVVAYGMLGGALISTVV